MSLKAMTQVMYGVIHHSSGIRLANIQEFRFLVQRASTEAEMSEYVIVTR